MPALNYQKPSFVQPITLICENCGREFEARAHRRMVHCRECAEDLRYKRQGPVQTKRRIPANLPYSSVQAKEICWEQAENDLAYYVKRFNRYPTYDGVTPSDLDRITDEESSPAWTSFEWLAESIYRDCRNFGKYQSNSTPK